MEVCVPSTSNLPAWLADAFGSLATGDVNGYLSIYAPDAVHEFPWAPEGRISRLEGRDEIADYMTAMLANGRFHFGTLDNVRVHEAGDETIVEADGHHRRKTDGAPVDLSYIWFITRRN